MVIDKPARLRWGRLFYNINVKDVNTEISTFRVLNHFLMAGNSKMLAYFLLIVLQGIAIFLSGILAEWASNRVYLTSIFSLIISVVLLGISAATIAFLLAKYKGKDTSEKHHNQVLENNWNISYSFFLGFIMSISFILLLQLFEKGDTSIFWIKFFGLNPHVYELGNGILCFLCIVVVSRVAFLKSFFKVFSYALSYAGGTTFAILLTESEHNSFFFTLTGWLLTVILITLVVKLRVTQKFIDLILKRFNLKKEVAA